MKVTGSSGVFKTIIYLNGSYLLLFGSRKVKSLKVPCE